MLRRSIAALLALLVLSACGGDPKAQFNGTVLDHPYDAPTVSLTDTEGDPFSLAADTDKRLTLVFFGYTHCPDICPAVMGALASAMTRLDDADRDQVDVVFVTTDPARDTEPVLRDYLDTLDPGFIGLTGDLQTIIEAGESLALYVSDGDVLPSGGYDLGGHSTYVLGIDSDDRAPVYWDEATSAAQFASDIHSLLED